MTTQAPNQRKRILSPVERFSEILFGLIMVLTFTGSLSIAKAGREDVKAMLIGAIGCNIAWGIVDAVMYILSSLAERRHVFTLVQSLRHSRDPEQIRRVLAHALPESIAPAVLSADTGRFSAILAKLPDPLPPRVSGEVIRGAIGVFLLVLLATFPVVLPFVFFQDPAIALRVSNAVAMVLLFLSGFMLGRYAGHRPVLLGLMMVVLGALLVLITMALGG